METSVGASRNNRHSLLDIFLSLPVCATSALSKQQDLKFFPLKSCSLMNPWVCVCFEIYRGQTHLNLAKLSVRSWLRHQLAATIRA